MPGGLRGPPPLGGTGVSLVPGKPPIPADISSPPKSKMKNFNWAKLKPSEARGDDTIWREIDFETIEIDFGTVEVLFGRPEDKKKDKESEKKKTKVEESTTKQKKSEKIGLIDPKRQQNMSITLARLGMPPNEIKDAVMHFKTKLLSQNSVELLKLISPEPDELATVKNWLSTDGNDIDKLKPAERFVAEILQVPRFNNKIVVMDLRYDFENQVGYLALTINQIRDAVKSIMASIELKRIMGSVLLLGNFINHGSFRGGAEGFKLSTLEAMMQLRTNSPKECPSLLHYLVQHAASNDKALLDISKKLDLTAAAQVSMSILVTSIKKLERGLKTVVTELELCEQSPSESMFVKAASSFATTANSDFELVQKAYGEVSSLLDKFADFFCIDRKTFNFEDTVKTLKAFIDAFKQAALDNERTQSVKSKRDALEKRRRELDALKPKGPGTKTEGNGTGKTVDNLLSTMNRGDKSVFKQRRQSAATGFTNGRRMSMKSSLDSMREKVAANWDSDNSIDSEGSDWED